jgi:ribosomal protein S18 acetylase RimI-like enzyme
LSETTAAASALILRRTLSSDLAAIVEIERHPENAPFIGQWSLEQHAECLAADGQEHLTIAYAEGGDPAGYLIAYDLTAHGFGIWVQRIAVTDKSRGAGRAALAAYLSRAMPLLNAETAVLDVMKNNERAQRAYRAVGFAPVDLPAAERARLAELVGGIDDGVIVMQLAAGDLRAPEGTTVLVDE